MAALRLSLRSYIAGRNVADPTLTVSIIERAVVLRHLTIQRHHPVTHPGDVGLLDYCIRHLQKSRTISLPRLEAVCMLRYLRKQTAAILRDMMALEERRIRGGVDGHLDAAYRVLDAEVGILQDVIRRLWQIVI